VFVSGITFGLVPVLVNIPEKFIDYIKTFSGGIILALTYKNRCRLKLKSLTETEIIFMEALRACSINSPPEFYC
jgi:hypothetical protein